MSRARAPLYFTYRLELDSSLSRRLVIPPFDFMTVVDTNANIDNISVSIDDLERVRLRDIIPLELGRLARSITVYWSPGEVGKYVVFLFGGEYRGFRRYTDYVIVHGDLIGLSREATLQQVRDRLPTSLTTAGNLKTGILEWGGAALTPRDISADLARLQNLDVTLTVLSRLKRWGRDVNPIWVHGGEVTAPAAGTALVSVTVSAGKSGYIYGFFIAAGEPNDFKINWTSGATALSIRIPLAGKGAVQYVDFAALNEGSPASAGTTISITNVNAGSAGVVYQARLLYAEV